MTDKLQWTEVQEYEVSTQEELEALMDKIASKPMQEVVVDEDGNEWLVTREAQSVIIISD